MGCLGVEPAHGARSRGEASGRPRGRPLAFEPLERRDLLAGGVPTPDHVVIVFEENKDYSFANSPDYGIVGYPGCPYINSLVAGSDAAVFTQCFAETHPSQPNYIDLFSGDNQGVTDDSVPPDLPFTTPNFGAALLAKGLTFNGYAEDMPYAGYTGSQSGEYVSKHCPWVNWIGTGPNGIPAADSQPLTAFPSDYSTLPSVSFVMPNMDDDMHNFTCP